jgi:hypothetical protein
MNTTKRTLINPPVQTTRTIYMLFNGRGEYAELHSVHADKMDAQVRSDDMKENYAFHLWCQSRVVTRAQLESILEESFESHADFLKWGAK